MKTVLNSLCSVSGYQKYHERKFHITVLLLCTERKGLIPHKKEGLKELRCGSEHVQGMKFTIKTPMCFNHDI